MSMIEAMIQARDVMILFFIICFVVVILFNNPPMVLTMGLLCVLFAGFLTYHKDKLEVEQQKKRCKVE